MSVAERGREIVLELNAPQEQFFGWVFDSETGLFLGRRQLMAGWGRGVGKSEALCQLSLVLQSLHHGRLREGARTRFRGCRTLFLAPTLKQWKGIYIERYERELGRGGRWEYLNGHVDRSTGHVTFARGGWIIPAPATPHNAQRIKGYRADAVLSDEIDDMAAEVYFSVMVPVLSEPFSLGLEVGAGTPLLGKNGLWWLYMKAGIVGARLRAGERPEDVLDPEDMERFRSLAVANLDRVGREDEPGMEDVVEALKGCYSSRATYKDVPETVDRRAVARAISNTPEDVFKREWLADETAGEGLVYSEFNPDFHVVGAPDCPWRQMPALTDYRDFAVGVDHGHGSPGVHLLGGVMAKGEYATLFLLDEKYSARTSNSVWNAHARTWLPYQAKWWADPSRDDRIDDLKQVGCRIEKADNNIAGGLARIADLLHVRQTESGRRFARLYVSPRCKNLIHEFGVYKFRRARDGSFSDTPEDGDDHCLDALKYLCLGRFGRHSWGGRVVVPGR